MPHSATPLLEACVTTPEDAAVAVKAGAGRVELCRELSLGGLTPPIERLRQVKAASSAPVFAMLRARAGSFVLEPGELAGWLRKARALLAAGADGLVLGPLDRDGRPDRQALLELVAAAEGRPVTFHRAFDGVEDMPAALDALVECGVTRLLTAGGPGGAWSNRASLKDLVRRAEGRLTVIAGGGVRGGHAVDLVEETGLSELHARASAIPGLVQAFGDAPPEAPTKGPDWKDDR